MNTDSLYKFILLYIIILYHIKMFDAFLKFIIGRDTPAIQSNPNTSLVHFV